MSKIQPLEVKEMLKELKNKTTKFISIIDDEKSLLSFQAKGEYPYFFFKVTGYKMFNGTETGTGEQRMCYDIHYLPHSKDDEKPLVNKQYSDGVNYAFDTWLQLVADYAKSDNNQGFLNKLLDLLPKRNAITNIKKRITSLSIGIFLKKALEILSWIAGIVSMYIGYKTLYP